MSEHEKLGRAIRTAREAKASTQEAAARAFGVTVTTWARWERGESAPNQARLRELADFLSTTVRQLAWDV